MIRILELFGEPILNGGQESFAINVVNSLEPNKYHIDFLTPYSADNKEYEDILRKRKSNIYALGLDFNPGGIKFNTAKPIKKFLKQHKYDIVHINSGSTFFLAIAAYISKSLGVKKVIVHSHSSGEKENIKHKLIKFFAAFFFSLCADEICAPSLEAAKWKFSKKLISKKLIIIKNGIDINRFKFSPSKRKDMRKELRISDDTLLLGHVGRFTKKKNQVFLVNLLTYLRNTKFKLILIGDGDTFTKVKAVSKKLAISKNIYFVGRKNNPEDYLQAMDVFLLPSKYEGLGLVAIEAQCSGLPVIASNMVPKDIKITPHVSFLSINDVQGWIHKLKEYSRFERKDESNLIKKSGFDEIALRKNIKKLYTLNQTNSYTQDS